MQAVEKWMSTRGSYLDPVDQLLLASSLAKASVEVFPECAEALVLRGMHPRLTALLPASCLPGQGTT